MIEGNSAPEVIAGLHLVGVMSDRIQLSLAQLPSASAPDGPDFLYEACPDLFLGRRGRGPLRIMWDTNLLIDYFEHGRSLWDGDALPDSPAAGYGEEMEALQLELSGCCATSASRSRPAP